jgi:hypothetical protein
MNWKKTILITLAAAAAAGMISGCGSLAVSLPPIFTPQRQQE